ncbi:hypothetical protein GEV33_000003 [Tenebrio molitor]|uniref:Uncharacterized protein n=1 Tax=Tenebrio molitor TaxID=7067 RepID=A0A8J6LKY9_TENMO|nr:hypothetical protein GEV33_000003 [Tenebrio molitor]
MHGSSESQAEKSKNLMPHRQHRHTVGNNTKKLAKSRKIKRTIRARFRALASRGTVLLRGSGCAREGVRMSSSAAIQRAQWGEWPVWLAKIRKLKVEISMFVVYSLIEEVLVDLDPKDLGKNVVCLLPWGSRNLALSSKQSDTFTFRVLASEIGYRPTVQCSECQREEIQASASKRRSALALGKQQPPETSPREPHIYLVPDHLVRHIKVDTPVKTASRYVDF